MIFVSLCSWHRNHELHDVVRRLVGRRYRAFGFPSGNGYFVGVAYREAEGAAFVGGVIGYAIDIATPFERPDY